LAMTTESLDIHALKEAMGYLDKHRTVDDMPIRMLIRRALESMRKKYPDMSERGKPIPHPYAKYEDMNRIMENA